MVFAAPEREQRPERVARRVRRTQCGGEVGRELLGVEQAVFWGRDQLCGPKVIPGRAVRRELRGERVLFHRGAGWREGARAVPDGQVSVDRRGSGTVFGPF